MKNLTTHQEYAVSLNVGKWCNIVTFDNKIEKLFIHSAYNHDGVMCYLMHKSEKPKYPFTLIDSPGSVNCNINNGYWIVQPFQLLI